MATVTTVAKQTGAFLGNESVLLPGSDITKGGQEWWLRRCACYLRLCVGSCTPDYFYLIVVGDYGYCGLQGYDYKTKSL